jgi:hypothetical protein
MGNVGTYTLAQAIFGRVCVYVVCQRCGHFGLISFEQSLKLGQSTPVAEIEKRFRCRVCKARQARIQPDRPMTGERVCPKCGAQLWRPAPMDNAGPKCSRCGRLMRR